MRILYHHRIASKDGQAVHIRELISALRRRGHEVIIVGPTLGGNEKFGGESRVVALMKRYLPKAFYELLEFLYSIVAYRAIERAYRIHRPDLIYERFNLFLLAGCWLHYRHGVPYFLEVNSPLYQERVKYSGVTLKALSRWSQRITWRSADQVLPVTNVLRDYILAEGVPAERITVVPNGINTQRFLRTTNLETAKEKLGLTGRIVLGFTGFVREWHGLSTLIDFVAANEERKLHLLIVGDGPDRLSLVSQAERLCVADRVTFTGVVEPESVASFVAAFDIALQPSVTPYASPLKVFEYMALGRAIVAPKSANIEEILSDGDNAILFPPDDKEALCACIERLCADPDLREQIGASARLLIEERRLTWDHNADRLEGLFRQVIDR